MVWITDDGRLERNGRSDASPNGQDSGLRSRGLVHPEHALCLAELCPDEIGRATDAEDEQVTKERFLCVVTLVLRLEVGVRGRNRTFICRFVAGDLIRWKTRTIVGFP